LKNVLVTGGGGGIGYALAKKFVQNGHFVIIAGKNSKKLFSVKNELGEMCETRKCDLVVKEERDRLCSELKDRVDILVNNAGVGYYGNFSEQPFSKVAEMIDLNCTAVAHLVHSFADSLANKCGQLVTVSSGTAFQPVPGIGLYAASKAFITVLHESTRREFELKKLSLRTTLVFPGRTKTEFFRRAGYRENASKKIGQDPEKVAAKIFEGIKNCKPVVFCSPLSRLQYYYARFFGLFTVGGINKLVSKHL
jgi:hypothetical protein